MHNVIQESDITRFIWLANACAAPVVMQNNHSLKFQVSYRIHTCTYSAKEILIHITVIRHLDSSSLTDTMNWLIDSASASVLIAVRQLVAETLEFGVPRS